MQPVARLISSFRDFSKALIGQFAVVLNRLTGGRLSPNAITLTSLFTHIIIAYLVAQGSLYWAAGLLLVFGLFDALDGAIARIQKTSSPRGMLLDSITDRMKEAMLYVGASYYFIAHDLPYYAVWAVAACGVSMLVSYVNAWGEAVVTTRKTEGHKINLSFRSGIMTYDVRMTIFFIGLLAGRLDVIVVLVAITSSFTALGRMRAIMQRL
ncbi:CDP-alcohol phosphatidyltransferase family protein [Candidatus Saccharibacteria bacterium]|nr:MAG: CDP-alcohol phosphatidyltransferase family protein [Candidatus Saccharibacteria bacterium]